MKENVANFNPSVLYSNLTPRPWIWLLSPIFCLSSESYQILFHARDQMLWNISGYSSICKGSTNFFVWQYIFSSLQMSLQALFLGIVFGGGTILSLGHLPVAGFGWYLCVLSFFHFSEFIFTALYQYPSLTVESFLLNHSFAYAIAAFSSWMEFFLELYFFPCEYSWCNCNCN